MKNIFIIGPVASGKTTISQKIAQKINMNCFDTGLLFRFLGWAILNMSQICPDLAKIEVHDQDEIERVLNEIHYKKVLLEKELNYISLQKQGQIIYKDSENILNFGLYSERINTVVSLVAQSATARKMILKFIQNKLSEQKGRWILTGHTLFDLKLSDFVVVYLHVSDEIAAQRLIQRIPDSYKSFEDAHNEVLGRNRIDGIVQSRKIIEGLYEKIYVDTDNIDVDTIVNIVIRKVNNLVVEQRLFAKYQQENAYDTSTFTWISNPFLAVIKKFLQEKLPVFLNDYPQIDITDLIYQILIHVCAYPINMLFKGNVDILMEVNAGIKNRDAKLFERFFTLYKENVLTLNEELIAKEIEYRIIMLSDIIKNAGIEKKLAEINNMKINSFAYFFKKDDEILDVQPIDRELSFQIFRTCHYLHTPRTDEYAAYGAFYKGIEFPIAAVSVSLHDRNYKKQLLDYMGLESHNFLEVTRSWCSNIAPKNTQSFLLEYAMKDLRKKWREKKRYKEVTNVLQGFTTTIDPNLDFHATSFLGCNFRHFALRPAKYNYVKIGNINYFKTRRDISYSTEKYFKNQINILPLNEMIRVFDERKIGEQHRKVIYQMDSSNYERINTK